MMDAVIATNRRLEEKKNKVKKSEYSDHIDISLLRPYETIIVNQDDEDGNNENVNDIRKLSLATGYTVMDLCSYAHCRPTSKGCHPKNMISHQ